MDRQIVYPGSIPLDTDILSVQRNTMVALGYLAQAAIGSGTFADGLSCTQQAVANMTVNIGPGSLMSLSTIDATAFGSLAADNTDPLVKMGINPTTVLSSTLATMTAPGTTGQSINYLIQATFTETDTTSVVLPYYNSSNPAAPYSGPSNSGTPQNTQRLQRVTLSIKSGPAATSGTQLTPSPDANNVGLWVITIAYAQTSITTANIVAYPTAPFIGTKVAGLRRKLTGNTTVYVNGTTGNDLNNGLTPTTAWQTLSGAWSNILRNFDLAGYAMTVSVADGTYAGAFITGVPVGAGLTPVTFVGDVTTPTNCVINAVNSSCFIANAGGCISVSGFQFTASGTGSNQGIGLYASSTGGVIYVSGPVNFGSCAVADVGAIGGGEVQFLNAAYTISGNSGYHWYTYAGGSIFAQSITVTLSGTPAFSSAFAGALGTGANVSTGAMTYSGAATGQRYLSTNGGYVNTGTGVTTTLPGNAAGVSTTGYYG